MAKHQKLTNGLLAALLTAAFSVGCSTEIDHDATRAGAMRIELDVITSDELYPSAGDEIDWKMIFIDRPGDIILDMHLDDPASVFNVHLGIYDRFGIPIKTDRYVTGASSLNVRGFSPESGLHYIKISAESGRSLYTLIAKHELNENGYREVTEPPSITEIYDFEAELEAAKNGGADRKAGGAGGSGGAGAGGSGGAGAGGSGGAGAGGAGGSGGAGAGGAGAAGGAPAGGAVLPAAASGGAILPVAVSGGIASAGGVSAGPTVVAVPSGGGGSSAGAEVRTINTHTAAVSNTAEDIKPIVADINGHYTKIDAKVISITPKKKTLELKLNAGTSNGVRQGAVGEIYVGGNMIKGGRFKVTSITKNNCIAETNARKSDLSSGDVSVVIKSPD